MARRLAGCSIFVLERDASTAYGLRTVLEAAAAEVSFASDPGEALVRLNQADFHAAILDGIECFDVRKALGSVPFLLYVARASSTVAMTVPFDALNHGHGGRRMFSRERSGRYLHQLPLPRLANASARKICSG